MDELLALEPLSTSTLILNLALGALLSGGVAWYYARYGEALSNRAKLARQLPLLCLTTILIISIIKSSLALSLGLVGALSIVRFRTAIKEPEELIYLFIAIAIGIGLGADQRLPTIISICILVILMIVSKLGRVGRKRQDLYLSIQVPDSDESSSLDVVNDALLKHARAVDMRRLDRRDQTLQLTYYVDCKDEQAMLHLTRVLRDAIPDGSFTFVHQENSPRW